MKKKVVLILLIPFQVGVRPFPKGIDYPPYFHNDVTKNAKASESDFTVDTFGFG